MVLSLPGQRAKIGNQEPRHRALVWPTRYCDQYRIDLPDGKPEARRFVSEIGSSGPECGWGSSDGQSASPAYVGELNMPHLARAIRAILTSALRQTKCCPAIST